MLVRKNEIKAAARQILEQFPDKRIFILDGEMGAGKTTFTTAFAEHLGAVDHVSSPTFAIANVYLCADGKEIYHFDFYRIESLQEALDIGVEEYFQSGNYCFIEWPDIVSAVIPEDALRIQIKHTDNEDVRDLIIT
jgi:tRNA threonylcarbamoyladenosine biosynthesis protein TsaE